MMYDLEISDDSVNKARQTLFTQKDREIENIPLTKDASTRPSSRISGWSCVC